MEYNTHSSDEDDRPSSTLLSPGCFSLYHCGWGRHIIEAKALLQGEGAAGGKMIVVLRGRVMVCVWDKYRRPVEACQMIFVPKGMAWYAEALEKAKIIICDCSEGMEAGCGVYALSDQMHRHISLVEVFLLSGIESEEFYDRHRRELCMLFPLSPAADSQV